MSAYELLPVILRNGYSPDDLLVALILQVQNLQTTAKALEKRFGVIVSNANVGKIIFTRGIRLTWVDYAEGSRLAEKYHCSFNLTEPPPLYAWDAVDCDGDDALKRMAFEAMLRLQNQKKAQIYLNHNEAHGSRGVIQHICRKASLSRMYVDYDEYIHLAKKYNIECVKYHRSLRDPVRWDVERHDPALWTARMQLEEAMQEMRSGTPDVGVQH